MSRDGIDHPLTAEQATRRIHEMARDPQVSRTFSGHARQRMRERQIHADWVDHVLREGHVDEARHENGTWRYRVAFVDEWGRTAVVTAIPNHDTLVIVTVTCSE
ncbi:DUF4258 domain-containing protein [Thioalkalivibrio sp. ALJ15]|uniref:DUF4258 domain-containing protein n=1 Tax=Thioalkalivibrio sp. ALJ15 TaxID=748652 RepID=UPI001E4FE9B4|nr:DUF4258 domain-containing protein [Thioalkalivibrio sp. ALJ15]